MRIYKQQYKGRVILNKQVKRNANQKTKKLKIYIMNLLLIHFKSTRNLYIKRFYIFSINIIFINYIKMGRKKLEIKKIRDDKIRHITYCKRKIGLFKKAAELALLCGANVTIMLADQLGNHTEFQSQKEKSKQPERVGLHPLYTVQHYPKFDTPLLVDPNDTKETEKTSNQSISEVNTKLKESNIIENVSNSNCYQVYQPLDNMNIMFYPYNGYSPYFQSFQ